MTRRLIELRWKIYKWLQMRLTAWGLKHGYVWPYSEALIEKLRTIYYGGMPASILLLCDNMCNGYCYDRATLMARAFLDEKNDVKLIYASVAGLRFNPQYAQDKDPLVADHCFVEVADDDGRKMIIDTSSWFIWDKRLYWLLEQPRTRASHTKEEIREYVEADEFYSPNNSEDDKYWMPLILPMIELTYGQSTEFYSQPEIEILQREVELYKETIDYDGVCREIDEDMQARGFKRLGSFTK